MTKWWLIGGAAFLGVLLIASVAVALTEKERPLPEGSPEASVQLYLKAIEQEDFKVAYELLTTEKRKDCTVEEFVGGNVYPGDDGFRNRRITLEKTNRVNGTAFMTVRITESSGGGGFPFGPSEYSFEQRFTLRQEEGQWRFSEYPWPYQSCQYREKPAPTPPVPAPATP